MIIWSGNALIGVLLAVVGTFIGFSAGEAFFEENSLLKMVVGIWGGVLFFVIYAHTLGKAQSETLIDPSTGASKTFHHRHTIFFIPVRIWSYLGVVFAVFSTVVGVNSDGFEGAIVEARGTSEREELELPTKSRERQSVDGEPLTASLLEVLPGEKGRFLRIDGKEFEVAFDKFAEDDRALLERIAQANR